MRKFEIGNIYEDCGVAYKITGRTAKFVKYVEIQHLGRFNERASDEKKAKISQWDGREVFFPSCRTIEA
jgi:hypothetical protein